MPKDNQQIVKNLIDSYGSWFEDEKQLDYGRMTSDLYPYNNIFKPIQINKVKVKNRLVMAPMGNIQMAEETGRPNEQMIQYFTQRAKGGVGLITSGLIPISYGIDPSLTEKGDLTYFPRIDRSRTVFSGWRELASNIHSYGAKFFIQLTPGLGRVGNPQCLVNSFKFPISASWNPNFYISQIPCKRLSDRKLRKIVKNAGQASADAKSAQIDGVYLHGHEGYFLEQMTNTAFNRRKVGRYSNWQQFGLDLVKEIRKRCGESYPIMYRIDLSLALNETYGEKMDEVKSLKKFKKERTVDMTLEYMKNLVKAGVDIFDVDLGCYDNWWLPHPPASMPPACFIEIAELVKKFLKENNIVSNAGIEVPVVAVGKLGYPDIAEKTLAEEKCDMVMLGRPLLADPYWPQKVYEGRIKDIRPCIGCQEGCINEFVEGGHPQCAVNPLSAFEYVYGDSISKAEKVKKVAVVGGGPAGVMCAVIAADRGHDVELFEKNKKIGGLLRPGSQPKIKFDLINYLNYLELLLNRYIKENKIKFINNFEVDLDYLKEQKYDVIVNASGTKQIIPKIEGINNTNVVLAVDLLMNPEIADKAENIVILGGGVVGCETAYLLSYEKNKNVKVVEMMPYFMNHVCTANRGFIIHYLEKKGVELLNCTKLKSINKDTVTVIRNISNTVPNPYITWAPILPENVKNPLAKEIKVAEKEKELDADLVVIAAGGKPNDELYYQCIKEHTALEIYNIGDSLKMAKVFEAVKAAYSIGRSI